MKAYVLVMAVVVIAVIAAQCAVTVTPEAAVPAAQAGSPPELAVTEPWARISPMSAGNGAVYLNLVNQGGSADVLLSAESDAAEAVELHETKMGENEVMQMSPVARIEVPAGGSVSLEPGGKHIMLINLKQELAADQTIVVTLNFEKSDPVTVEAVVRPASAGEGMSHSN